MFTFRSGTHGLIEELGRHSDRDSRVEHTLCGAECESAVPRVLLIALNFQEVLKQWLGASYAEFKRLSTAEKTYERKLGEQLQRFRFAAFSEGIHSSRMGSVKNKNYTVMTHTQVTFSASPRLEIRGPVAGVGGMVSKSGKSGNSHGEGKGRVVQVDVNCVCSVCGSTHSCGCAVNGRFARAAF